MTHTALVTRTKHALVAGLFILATVILPFSSVQNASAATLTWDGSAGDGLFSTAANWSTDTVPVDGDVLVFPPASSGTENQTVNLTNDLSGVELAGLQAAWSNSGFSTRYYIDTMSFQNNPTLNSDVNGSKYVVVYIEESVQVAGNLTYTENNIRLYGDIDVSGNLTASRTINLGAGSSVGGVFDYGGAHIIPSNMTISGTALNGSSQATLQVKGPSSTIGSNFTFNPVPGNSSKNQLAFGNCSQEVQGVGAGPSYLYVPCGAYGPATYNLTGTITLNTDLMIHVASQSVVNITGNVVTNGHTISLEPNSLGILNIGESRAVVPEVTTELEGDLPSATKEVDNKETAVLDGTRGTVKVLPGGVFKGAGTVQILEAQGKVSPGNSPGTITVLQTYSADSGSTLEMELLNADTYDQLIVGEDYSGGGNAVSLNGTLSTILFDGWAVDQGDQFRIIDNRSSAAVSGTFTGLPEGTQFVVDGITFSISYVGGDGNDVVLTAINSGTDPDAPNTGIAAFVTANPAIVAAAGLVGIMTLIIVSKVVARQRA